MKFLIYILALLCNLISLILHSNIKSWVAFGQPSYMRNNFSLGLFFILSFIIGVVITCGLTGFSWYWNVLIYSVGALLICLASDMITEQNTKFHMYFMLENRPWSIYVWTLTVISFILALYGYNLS